MWTYSVEGGFTSVISVIVATKLEPTEPRDPTKYPSSNDFLTNRCDMR